MIKGMRPLIHPSIDDITQTKKFHAFDTAQFNHDEVRHNTEFLPLEPGGGIDSSLDWHIDSRSDAEDAMTYTMGMEIDATAAAFPGACRVLATSFGADLRALCPS